MQREGFLESRSCALLIRSAVGALPALPIITAMGTAPEYAAFISYRHLPCDTEAALRVQRAIERYRLPRSMAMDGDAACARKRMLGRCFRDEDELEASHSLPERIEEALAQARSLIVICTPDTADSLWVLREIAKFVELHGPERVICVLARGSSAESIPAMLRVPQTIQLDGAAVEAASSPLAADLRPQAARKRKTELLRVIAAVAGCRFDDLKQRQRKRQRTRRTIIAGIAAGLIGLIAALSAWAMSASQEQLIAESNALAAQAQRQLSEGDRMGALGTALAALPASSSDGTRPVTPDAESALEAAVQADPDPHDIWRPSFILETPGNVASFTSSVAGNWAAILDDSGTVSVFSLMTGALRFRFSVESHVTEGGLLNAPEGDAISDDWMISAAGAEDLVLANRTGEGSLAVFDAEDGHIKWEQENVVTSSLALSEDGSEMAVLSIFEETAYMTGLLDVETGEVLEWGEYDDPGFLEFPLFLPSYLDGASRTAYQGIGGYLIRTDFAEGAMDGTRLNDHMIASLDGADGTIVAVSTYRADEAWQAPVSVDAIKDGTVLWTWEGTYRYDIIGDRFASTAVGLAPSVAGIAGFGTPCAVVTAGNEVMLLDLRDGSLVASEEYGNAIVGAGLGWNGEDDHVVYVATADGALDIWMPSFTFTNGTTTRTMLPTTLRDASIQRYEDAGLLALLQTADASPKLFVYWLDIRNPDETADLTLDELISEAHRILDANADPIKGTEE